MWTKTRRQISQVLTGCWVLLWLAGSLFVAHESLTPQWTTPHCPQGQTQNGQHHHNHCGWHCVGFDTQGIGGGSEFSTDGHMSRVWKLGAMPFHGADSDGEFPPRGPPHAVVVIA